MLKEKILVSKVAQFQTIVSESEFTNLRGEVLEMESSIEMALDILIQAKKKKSTVFLAGNGGSAAVVSHILTDFTNVGGLRAATLHESSLLTCMANDYGYENAFASVLKKIGQKNDVLITVSSSGRSLNIINAAKCLSEIGGKIITLSGFDPENPLRRLGSLNIWLNSNQYGFVEIGHLFLLHHLSDRLKESV